MTQGFRRFLSDFRAEKLRNHVARFTLGHTLDEKSELREQMAVLALQEVLGVTFLHVARFYGEDIPTDATAYGEDDPLAQVIPEGFEFTQPAIREEEL